MSEKLLIVEDDKKLNDGIRLALKNDAYFFYQCRTLQEAREILKKEDITLVLLDVNLPDGNGIDFVREIRKNSQVPIILLTVNNMEVDIVTGLEAGANDYITKPFSLMVLRARVSVQLRNKEAAAKNSMELDGFEFYFDKMEFFKDGEPIELSKTEQKLLRVLCENRGKVLKREYLIDEVWQGDTEFVDAHALTVAIKRLRDKLEDDTQKMADRVWGSILKKMLQYLDRRVHGTCRVEVILFVNEDEIVIQSPGAAELCQKLKGEGN